MSTEKESLSVVIPAYNEAANVRPMAQALRQTLEREKIRAAVYFVDDGSSDDTWAEIGAAASEWDMVRGIRFSRNFGKEAAIFAGLQAAAGDCCAVMDGDMQHPVETLVEMYRLWESGYEVIEGVKEDRGRESVFYKGMSALFYRLMSAAVKMDMRHTSDFKLLDRKAVDALASLPERSTFFRALSGWVGYKSCTVGYRVQERVHGESKWTTWSLVKYALNNIVSFTTKPLHLVTAMGMLFLLLSVVQGIECLVTYVTHRAVEGFTTVILIQLITGSIVMLSLGIIGGYIAKIYEEVKGRHRFIVAQTIGTPIRRERDDDAL